MKQRGNRYCPACSSKLQKRGLTKAGTQRWYCPKCAKSSCRGRPDLVRKLLLSHFVKWLLGKESQVEIAKRTGGYTDRTWRSKTAWCWEIAPPRILNPLPQRLNIILMDGTRVAQATCLIARTIEGVVTWQFSPWESSEQWQRLIYSIPSPQVAVVDGQKGVLKAIATHWPAAKIQRCHFHIWLNIRSKLTLNPKTLAGVELLALSRTLLNGINTQAQKEAWLADLSAFGKRHEQLLKERSYGPVNPFGSRRWWYTHRNLRSAYKQLTKLVESSQLFTYLDELVTDIDTGEIVPIPRTTNHVEGGINSQLRHLLRQHRGLPAERQMRLTDWYLHTRKIADKTQR